MPSSSLRTVHCSNSSQSSDSHTLHPSLPAHKPHKHSSFAAASCTRYHVRGKTPNPASAPYDLPSPHRHNSAVHPPHHYSVPNLTMAAPLNSGSRFQLALSPVEQVAHSCRMIVGSVVVGCHGRRSSMLLGRLEGLLRCLGWSHSRIRDFWL